MDELDDLLLEAAGRITGGRKRQTSPPPRGGRKFSYSDDGNDSKDDDSDDDRGYSSRKPSASQVPLKKRLDPTERDDDRPNHGDDVEEDGYHDNDSDDGSVGSDLFKGEHDREALGQMTELQREMILADRAAKITDSRLKKKKGKGSSPPPTHSRAVRSSTRHADKVAAKDGALKEIRAKRMRQQDPESHGKPRDAPPREGPGARGYSPVKRRHFIAATIGSPTQSKSQSQSDDEESTGDGGMVDSDDEKAESKWPIYEDIKEITIRRSKLAKWSMEPFFEDLIVGCFVRVGIGKSKSSGSIYRLCIVRNVDASDPDRVYRLDNKTTNKYLNVVWGSESSAARWQMAMVSDSLPTKDEFEQWVREVERSGGRMPSKQEVLEKKDAIKKTNTFVYSAETVKQMLQEKKSATWRPLNIAAEKDRLRRDMEIAKSKNDETEVERIKARLQELEATRQAQETDKKAIRLAEMNRKNRFENFKNASEVKQNAGAKAGEAGYDPFSRRWTRSRNYYLSKSGGEQGEPKENGVTISAPAATGAGVAATAAALQAAAGAGKLIDTIAPQGTESNALHNFELPISLASLQKFGGPQGAQAGFMARKQRIEATVGCKVPENDGRRHALTLTVSDYKRRRGLL